MSYLHPDHAWNCRCRECEDSNTAECARNAALEEAAAACELHPERSEPGCAAAIRALKKPMPVPGVGRG